MFRKVLLCILLVLSLCLFACGSDEDEKTNNNPTSSISDEEEDWGYDDGEVTPTEKPDNSKGSSSDKNLTGGDKTVTDGTTTKNPDNTINVGGIEFEMPSGSKKQDVFVGAGLTYEVKSLQGMIRTFYFDNTESNFVVSDVASFVAGGKDQSFETEFVGRYLDKYEPVEDSMITVAELGARKTIYKGVSNGDCYRDGPVKNLVEASLETICIYNDVEDKMVVVMALCKNAKGDAMDQEISKMLANAESKPGEGAAGLFGASHVENGGFVFEIPEAYGKLVDCEYDTFGESYAYYYGAKSQLSESLGMGISFAMNFDMSEMLGGFGGFGGMPPMGGFDAAGFGDGTENGFGNEFGPHGEMGSDMPEGNFGAGFGGFDGGFGGGMAGNLGGALFSGDSSNWLNILAVRQVLTKDEFAQAQEIIGKNVPTIFGMLLGDCECTLNEKIEVDGMDGIRFVLKGIMEETETNCQLVVVNNIRDRFVILVTSFYDAEGNELGTAFEDLYGSMKLAK